MPSPSPGVDGLRTLARQVVVFTGRLSSLGRRDARALVARLGGIAADDVTAKTTMLVVGDEGYVASDLSRTMEEPDRADGPLEAGSHIKSRYKSNKLKRAEELNAHQESRIQILSEAEFCRLAGVPTPEALKRHYHAVRDLLARYRALREDHLHYLVKAGVIRPVLRTNADTFFEFRDLAVIKQANDGLSQGG